MSFISTAVMAGAFQISQMDVLPFAPLQFVLPVDGVKVKVPEQSPLEFSQPMMTQLPAVMGVVRVLDTLHGPVHDQPSLETSTATLAA